MDVMNRQSISVMNDETQPLVPLRRDMARNREFCAYLDAYQLSILDVALAAALRLLVIWRVQQGMPVSLNHANRIYDALYKLTGVSYRPLIEVMSDER